MIADQFNYCAADGCHIVEGHLKREGGLDFCAANPSAHIELFEPFWFRSGKENFSQLLTNKRVGQKLKAGQARSGCDAPSEHSH